MNLKKIIKESIDDFDWMRGEINFTINDIIGKKMLFRDSNLSEIWKTQSLMDIQRNQLTLGKIRWDRGWYVDGIKDNGTVYLNLDGGEGLVDYEIDEVEKYVNLGVWALLDDNGNILNDFPNKNLNESEKILESLFNRLSLLTEDGKTEPDMVWDFTKKDIDKSKSWVKTKEDVKNYLKLLFSKINRLPKKIKVNILKYVLASFVGILTIGQLQDVVDEVSPEKIEVTTPQEIKAVEKPETKKEPKVIKKVKIRKPSPKLFDFLKDEEGLRTTAYDIGDGMITVGYGHAERKGDTDMVARETVITKEKAEELLTQDVKFASEALNRILDSWDKKGIKVQVTQSMYDAMTSMIFNMGIGNFRKSDFIQMVKRGEYDEAEDTIKKTNVTYPGHKPRREKESEMFGGSYNI